MTVPKLACIFDMDGVIVDNVSYHEKAWMEFGKKHGVTVTKKIFDEKISGRRNPEIVQILLGKKITGKELEQLSAEQPALYRELYKGKSKLIAGLEEFLKKCQRNNIPTALATSSPIENVEQLFNETNSRSFFNAITAQHDVTKGKPDPEIYLLSAKKLGVKSKYCIVFEDSLSGVASGKNADMKVIGITTTHTPEELHQADKTIKDYTEITLEDLA
ncbi:MAG: HAD family phosphatase [Candidatus Buchananbacteria bacterium CG10_big_fil_rev_8_21_14_0_10_42_9]|uniref:HAD family phosphatase n=1 Tax=Candidatus Buchananbacteria bacterium CG10_big_fil_rev_8_21_14_0_10_42_9 TaxID=1974526 RepID=A0A2H0W002_9BACT|nr:MAG: HAD family phosphatase [Candidatus Buchananbacteria bacterium CG10_big_fil_rev_8_21_14_0_10_42_9]